MYGYHGRSLIVDLSAKSTEWEAIPESILRKFIGGTGLCSTDIARLALILFTPTIP